MPNCFGMEEKLVSKRLKTPEIYELETKDSKAW